MQVPPTRYLKNGLEPEAPVFLIYPRALGSKLLQYMIVST